MATIGILGGMGPEATAELYLRIIRIFQSKGAVYDDEFPEMIVWNLPIPDIMERPSKEILVEKMLTETAKKMEKAGASFIVIPCNTASKYIPTMQEAVSVPIFSIVEETAGNIRQLGIQTVGLLGTAATIRSSLYEKALPDVKVIMPMPREQKRITSVIMNILAGKKKRRDRETLQEIIKRMREDGAERVVLGCTELPLLLHIDGTVDTLQVLADAVVREAKTP